MSKFTDNIKAWHVVLCIIAIIMGASIYVGKFLYAFDQKKADREELIALNYQVNAGFAEQERSNIQKRIWDIEDRYKCGPRYGNSCYNIITNKDVCNSYRDLNQQLKKVDLRLQRLYQKQKK